MVGYPFGLDIVGEDLELLQVVRVKRVGAADGHGNAMHHHGVVFADAMQIVYRLAARDHEILGQHFKPVDGRPVLQDMLEMGAKRLQEIGVKLNSKCSISVSSGSPST